MFFTYTDFEVSNCPVLSTDINPIENLWVSLVKEVDNNFRQLDYFKYLKEAIMLAWDGFDSEYVPRSMPRRCNEGIERKGSSTHYLM